MSTPFDPYLQWLGIRDPQRPPNHYRLLGLDLFENDPNVIAMSADRQMAHLRNFRTGPAAELAERLLNELSTARICLLKADRKASYDERLRETLTQATSPKSAPRAPVTVSPPTLANLPLPRRSGGSNHKSYASRVNNAWKPWALLASLLLVCLGLTLVLINNNSTTNESVTILEEAKTPTVQKKRIPAQTKPPELTTVTVKASRATVPQTTEGGALELETVSKVSANEATKTITKSLPEKATGNNKNKPTAEQLTIPDMTPSLELGPTLGEETNLKPAEKSRDREGVVEDPLQKVEATQVVQKSVPEQSNSSRIAVPDRAAVVVKEKEIRDIFAEEYKSQKPEIKAALAAKLHQSSAETKSDSTLRYILLNEARANAILGGNVKLAVEITEELVRTYEVNAGEEQFALFSKLLGGANRNAAYSQAVVDHLRKSLEKLQESDDFDVAIKLVNMAMTTARSLRDSALVTELNQRTKELNLQKQSYLRAKVAKDTLNKNPNDPAASELWGSYLCFIKGDFETGLPFLAKGVSADLAALAGRELANKKTPAEQLELADAWWTMGEKSQAQDTGRSVRIKQFAGQKYVDIFPKLSGIDKAKAEKRLAELSKIAEIKSKRDVDQLIAMLVNNKWQVFAEDGSPAEDMMFRADGTMVNRVFQTWVIENNQLILRGGFKTGDTWTYVGKTKIGVMEFDIDYILNGKHNWYAKVRPSTK